MYIAQKAHNKKIDILLYLLCCTPKNAAHTDPILISKLYPDQYLLIFSLTRIPSAIYIHPYLRSGICFLIISGMTIVYMESYILQLWNIYWYKEDWKIVDIQIRTIHINLDNTGIIAFNVLFMIEWISQSWNGHTSAKLSLQSAQQVSSPLATILSRLRASERRPAAAGTPVAGPITSSLLNKSFACALTPATDMVLPKKEVAMAKSASPVLYLMLWRSNALVCEVTQNI